MSRPSRRLLVLLALALCLQSSLALAHCLRLVAPVSHHAFLVELCTPDGMVAVDMGGPGDEAPAPHEAAAFCLACHGPATALLPEPSSVPLPAMAAIALPAWVAPSVAALGARAPPYRPTGPPVLS